MPEPAAKKSRHKQKGKKKKKEQQQAEGTQVKGEAGELQLASARFLLQPNTSLGRVVVVPPCTVLLVVMVYYSSFLINKF